ncbi:MAG: penicillin-binding protein activator, partial [Pseudomonadota bacterium]|nr:penicillin-binding protein activator [Pseudomonadota bacterium]
LNVDSSKNRYRTVRSLMREPVEFEPRRRQDADWLFLVALPEQARQIKPTLAFNFAGDLPVYATSHVFSGEVDVRKDRDLNGIYFCDVPWLLHDTSLKAEVDDVTGGQGGFTRLYAMGADAFRLVARVKQLEAFPESRIYGNTGALTLDNARRIHRSTDCTRFRSGKPVKLSESRGPGTTDD